MRSNLSAGDSQYTQTNSLERFGEFVLRTAESLHRFAVPLPLTREALEETYGLQTQSKADG